jgi:O-antigen/teichoic acid export membrane protein
VAVVARAVSLATLLVSVPLALGYLGPERYALWMALSSVFALVATADLGVGSGLVTAVAERDGRGDVAGIRSLLASGLFLTGLLGAMLLLSFLAARDLLAWNRLLGLGGGDLQAEADGAALAFVACVALSLPAGVVARVQSGLQAGYVGEAFGILGAVLGLAGLVTAVQARLGLSALVVAVAGAPALAGWLNTAWILAAWRPDLRPRWTDVGRPAVLRLLRTGGLYMVVQVSAAAAFSLDSALAARLLGPAAVTQHAVASRLFLVVLVGLNVATTPLWPAYAEALAGRDLRWVRRMLARSCLLAVAGAGVPAALLVVAGPTLLRLWVGARVSVGADLLVALACWTAVLAGGGALSAFLNGVGALRFLATSAACLAAVKLGLSVALARPLGVAGLVWATVAAYLVTAALPGWLFARRFFARRGAGEA